MKYFYQNINVIARNIESFYGKDNAGLLTVSQLMLQILFILIMRNI